MRQPRSIYSKGPKQRISAVEYVNSCLESRISRCTHPSAGWASGSNIRRSGKRFVYVVGHVTPQQMRQVARAARAGKVAGSLKKARFGLMRLPCLACWTCRRTKGPSRRPWVPPRSRSTWRPCSKPPGQHLRAGQPRPPSLQDLSNKKTGTSVPVLQPKINKLREKTGTQFGVLRPGTLRAPRKKKLGPDGNPAPAEGDATTVRTST